MNATKQNKNKLIETQINEYLGNIPIEDIQNINTKKTIALLLSILDKIK